MQTPVGAVEYLAGGDGQAAQVAAAEGASFAGEAEGQGVVMTIDTTTVAECLKKLESRVRSEACELEMLLEQSMDLTLKIMASRERLADSIRELEDFKVAVKS